MNITALSFDLLELKALCYTGKEFRSDKYVALLAKLRKENRHVEAGALKAAVFGELYGKK
jgi:hypothetical protein